MSSHQQTGHGHQPVTTGAGGNVLEVARAVLTITKNAQNLMAANDEDPNIGYGIERVRLFVPYTQL